MFYLLVKRKWWVHLVTWIDEIKEVNGYYLFEIKLNIDQFGKKLDTYGQSVN